MLVSCPCDVARTAAGRRAGQRVARIPRPSRAGTPAFAEDYVANLKRRGLRVRFAAVEGVGHGFSGGAAAAKEAVNDVIGR